MTDRRKLADPLAAPLAHALAAGLDRSGHDCPDAETLALCFDRALDATETARWERHFSVCARCQEQLAAMARMEPAAAASAAPQAAGVSWLWNWRWLAPAAAALGAVAIWVVVNNTTPGTPGPQVAVNRPQATQPVAAPPPSPGVESKAEDVAKDSAGAGHSGRASSELASSAGAKRDPAKEPARALSQRRDNAFAAKPAYSAETPTAPIDALADAKKDSPGPASAAPAESKLAKEEQAREARAKVAELAEAPREGQVALRAQQQVAQAPQAPRARERDLQGARDETKKTQAEPVGPVTETVTVEAASDSAAMRRQANEVAGGFRAANVGGSKVVWRFGPAGSIERTSDAGATWQRQSSGVTVDLLAGSAPSPVVCWAVGRGGIVLRTIDGGTWQQLGSPASIDLVAVEATSANVATVTTAEGKRYITTDGGRTWRSQ